MAEGAELAVQEIEAKPTNMFDLDSLIKTVESVRKSRQEKLKADQEFGEKLGDLDLKSQMYGIGRAYGDPKTGKIGIVPYPRQIAPQVSPASQIAWGASGGNPAQVPINQPPVGGGAGIDPAIFQAWVDQMRKRGHIR